jgi:rhamnosyltransferase
VSRLVTQTAGRTIGVAVITHEARHLLARSLPPLLESAVAPRVLVVNSSSNDGTVEEAERLGAETLVIPRVDFNHGTTRNLACAHLGTDVVVLTTPDAYAVGDAIATLTEPVARGDAAVAYGRQLVRPDAHVFERLLREFNYPQESHVRTTADAGRYGAYLTFCSNAFAAWDRRALEGIGGFRPTLSHEDAVAAAMLLERGYAVAYVAEAQVEHSHRYTHRGDFRRYFDAGYARTEHADVLGSREVHGSLGRRYALAVGRHVVHEQPSLAPSALVHLGAKWAGYAAGSHASRAPLWVKRRLSGQDYFWANGGSEPRGSGSDPA